MIALAARSWTPPTAWPDWPEALETPNDLECWRQKLHARLLARRLSSAPHERSRWSKAIHGHLLAGFPALAGCVVGFYWPRPGEPDPRRFVRQLSRRGSRVALPAVVAEDQRLEYRDWWPQALTATHASGRLMPVGTPVLGPKALLVPAIGFDADGWCLDPDNDHQNHLIATLDPSPIVIGLAYELLRVPTIHPQTYDLRPDFIVTEAGIHVAHANTLHRIHAAECARRLRSLMAADALPSPQTNGKPPVTVIPAFRARRGDGSVA